MDPCTRYMQIYGVSRIVWCWEAIHAKHMVSCSRVEHWTFTYDPSSWCHPGQCLFVVVGWQVPLANWTLPFRQFLTNPCHNDVVSCCVQVFSSAFTFLLPERHFTYATHQLESHSWSRLQVCASSASYSAFCSFTLHCQINLTSQLSFIPSQCPLPLLPPHLPQVMPTMLSRGCSLLKLATWCQCHTTIYRLHYHRSC